MNPFDTESSSCNKAGYVNNYRRRDQAADGCAPQGQQQGASYGQPMIYGQQAYRDAGSDDQARAAGKDGDWSYGLCLCCGHCDSCLEAWFCLPCQVSRQSNMLKHGRPEIDRLLCIVLCCCDEELAIWQIRSLTRQRYGISGNSLGDCCSAWCCSACVVQQILLEMTVRGEFPGATCYQDTSAMPPSNAEMV